MSQPEPRERHAVLIGINYVNDSQARLYGCINDAVQTKYFLQDAFGYPEDNITVLRDDTYEDAIPPTMSNILSYLTQLVNMSESCEEIWVHYSGHGTQVTDNDGDEEDGMDEVIIPSDYKESGIIRDDVLFAILSKSKCRTYLVMDCCHSGSIVDLPYLYDLNGDTLVRKKANRTIDTSMFENKEIYMIAGSRDTQTAADGWNYESRVSMGATTQALIETIREHNHHITLENLLREMHTWMEQRHFSQRPNVSCMVEEGIQHVIRKPEYEGTQECVKCKEYEQEIIVLQQEKTQIEKKLDKTTKESISAWYMNNDLKKRIARLQTTLNHFTIPEKVEKVERYIQIDEESTRQLHKNVKTQAQTRANAILHNALLRKQEKKEKKELEKSVDKEEPTISLQVIEEVKEVKEPKKTEEPKQEVKDVKDVKEEPKEPKEHKKGRPPATPQRKHRIYNGRRVFMLR